LVGWEMNFFDEPLPCAKCGQVPYATDSLLALNKNWHRDCFKCFACNNKLILGKECQHKGDPYCKKCYDAKFKHSGYGYSNTLSSHK